MPTNTDKIMFLAVFCPSFHLPASPVQFQFLRVSRVHTIYNTEKRKIAHSWVTLTDSDHLQDSEFILILWIEEKQASLRKNYTGLVAPPTEGENRVCAPFLGLRWYPDCSNELVREDDVVLCRRPDTWMGFDTADKSTLTNLCKNADTWMGFWYCRQKNINITYARMLSIWLSTYARMLT